MLIKLFCSPSMDSLMNWCSTVTSWRRDSNSPSREDYWPLFSG